MDRSTLGDMSKFAGSAETAEWERHKNLTKVAALERDLLPPRTPADWIREAEQQVEWSNRVRPVPTRPSPARMAEVR